MHLDSTLISTFQKTTPLAQRMEEFNPRSGRELQTAPFRCHICSQTFGKIQHLKRHASTHVDDKPYTCGFCDSEFKRSDALRRHWKTCTVRLASGDSIPQRSLSGKRMQACDRCAERKRACNQDQPCAECTLQEFECTYTRTKRRKSQVPTVGADVLDTDAINCDPESRNRQQGVSLGICQPRDQIGISSRRQFNFLLKFTHATGINLGYNCNRSFMVDRPSEITSPSADDALHTTPGATNPWNYLLEEISPWPDGGKGPLSRLNSPLRMDPGKDALGFQCAHIWNLFLPYCDQITGDSITMASVMNFFSTEHVLHSLDIFWDRWYPHCPILHRPTFNIENCSPLLLANMVLMGSCTSSSEADCRIAKSLLDVAETIVFSQPIYSTATTKTGMTKDQNDDEHTKANISILQATYLICIMQKWEGNDESKVRIQRDQFTKFVSVTRAMGLSTATHNDQAIDSDFDECKWRKWILKEEIIRTFTYVFLLDSAFVIFHNSVPRMVLQEMQIDLTCPEALFQTSSYTEFVFAIRSNPGLSPGSISLLNTVRRLCADGPNQAADFLDGASKLNLFTIATAIHGLIFHQKSSLYTIPSYENPLRKALDRWEVAWQLNSHRPPNPGPPQSANYSYEQHGFMQYADEFAVLARISLELSYMSPMEVTGFLGRLSEGLSREHGGAFATFDQASMGQVGDLILATEKLNLNL